MSILRMGSVGVGLLCFLAVGCQHKLHDENLALHQQNRELQAERDRMHGELRNRPDAGQLHMMQAEIAERDAEIARLQEELRQPSEEAGWQPNLDGIDATYDHAAGTVTVNLPGDILFDSGQAELKNSARSTLDKIVAAIRNDYPDKKVFVDGHTDTDPIRRTADKWEDNLDLSAARALSVARYLIDQGIESSQVIPRAFGPNVPRATKAESRRVEIVVMVR